MWVQVWTYARDLPGEGGGGWRDGGGETEWEGGEERGERR